MTELETEVLEALKSAAASLLGYKIMLVNHRNDFQTLQVRKAYDQVKAVIARLEAKVPA